MDKYNNEVIRGHFEEKTRDLLDRISNFEIDDGPTDFSFAQRLERENGWSPEYTERVINEYKRFVFLLASAGHPVTPSDQVDQAWHLHLTYTRSYWERLCRDVIGRPLHHTPTRGGHAELRKFNDWYLATLTSYRRLFGQALPSDIWPDSPTRFRDLSHYQRINTRQHLIIRKPPALQFGARVARKIVAMVGLAIALAVTVPLFASTGTNSQQGNRVPVWFIIAIFAGGVTAVLTSQLFQSRCLECRRFVALKKTGITDNRDDSKQWDEYQCKYCEARVWKEHSDDSGGGGGGCGGCGGGCGG